MLDNLDMLAHLRPACSCWNRRALKCFEFEGAKRRKSVSLSSNLKSKHCNESRSFRVAFCWCKRVFCWTLSCRKIPVTLSEVWTAKSSNDMKMYKKKPIVAIRGPHFLLPPISLGSVSFCDVLWHHPGSTLRLQLRSVPSITLLQRSPVSISIITQPFAPKGATGPPPMATINCAKAPAAPWSQRQTCRNVGPRCFCSALSGQLLLRSQALVKEDVCTKFCTRQFWQEPQRCWWLRLEGDKTVSPNQSWIFDKFAYESRQSRQINCLPHPDPHSPS